MYVPLYVKTTYSLLSSMITIPKLIDFCLEHHILSLAIADNTMSGVMEFIKTCEKNKIEPLIGLEIMLDQKPILFYAKNYKGYQNLMKLSTLQSEKNITPDAIKKYVDDVVIILPFISRDYENLFEKNDDLYFGYSNLEEEKTLYLTTKNVVFIPEIRYLEEKDKDYLPYLFMIRDGKTVADEAYSLKGYSSFSLAHLERYTDNTGLTNTDIIRSKCKVVFPKSSLLLPIYDVGNAPSQEEYLYKLAEQGLKKRLNGEVSDDYIKRLKYELKVIFDMGFADYFLVVYDFIRYAKKKGILVGPGRGSGAGSLVAYSLGITEIDPLKYQLIFERFLNPERITMPDIDTDFPDIYRDEVIDYVISKYGVKQVSGIVTFGTLSAKQVIRDVSRVLNIPLYKVDKLTKNIPTMYKGTLKELYQKNDRFRLQLQEDDSLFKMVEIASHFEGFPRHISSHAAGIVICQKDLTDVVPLIKNDDSYLTGYTMEYLEELGLLKMDFLGIKNLTTIMNVIEDIKKGEGVTVDFNQIPLDDAKTLKLFQEANTTGIFQFESSGMKNFLKELKPTSIEDIFAAIALFRPGPSQNIPTYIKRKHGLEPVTYLDPSLKDILEPTYGIIVYQEQIMQIAVRLAGYTLGEADILRRAMSKKKMEVLKAEEPKFIKQSVERGYSKETAKAIFDLILSFANYGFNRAHSVAYSIVAYKMAYLKVYYPKYFFASLFSSVIGSEIKTKEYLNEAKKNHIALLKPDINLSSDHYIVEQDGIRFPLSNIKAIGYVASHDILLSRESGAFTDIFDFLARCNTRSITSKTIESLIDASAFDSFGYSHRTLINNLDVLMNFMELSRDLEPDFILKPEIEDTEEFSKQELLEREKEVFGFYLSNHPSTFYRAPFREAITIEDIKNHFNRRVTLVVLLDNYRIIDTKKKEKMVFLTASDETGVTDFTMFPKVYLRYPNLERGKVIKIVGMVERRFNRFQVLVNEMEYLN